MHQALSETRRFGHVHTLVFVLTWVCWAEWAGGLLHEARRHAEEAIALSNEHGFPYLLGYALLHRGWSLMALGQPQEGFALLTEGRSVLSDAGAVAGGPWALALLTEANAKLGRPFDGLDCLAGPPRSSTRPTTATARRSHTRCGASYRATCLDEPRPPLARSRQAHRSP